MSHGREWRWFVPALIAADAFTISLAFGAAYGVRYGFGWLALRPGSASADYYLLVGALALPLWLGLFALCGLYQRERLLGGTQEYARLVNACTFGFAAIAMASFLKSDEPTVSRGWLVACLPLTILCAGTGRFLMRRLAYRLRRRGLFLTRAVIVGASAQAVAIARQLEDSAHSGIEVTGFLDDYRPMGDLVDGRWPVLGTPAALPDLPVDEAIVVQHALTWESLYELMCGLASGAGGPAVRLAPTFFDLLTAGMSVGQRANVPVIAVHQSRIAGMDAVLKRGFEFVLAAGFALALAPLMVWAALRRRMVGRPVLERRRYAGVQGHAVTVATLATDAPEAGLRRIVTKGPALFSVLRGDMALVGPRPAPYAPQGARAERLALRSVRPGLTGPLSLVRADISAEDALALELSYVRDYSIWRDLYIIWERGRMLLRTGATDRCVPARHAAPSAVGDGAAAWPAVPAESREFGR